MLSSYILTHNYRHKSILITQDIGYINIRFSVLLRSLKYCCKDKTYPWNTEITCSRVKLGLSSSMGWKLYIPTINILLEMILFLFSSCISWQRPAVAYLPPCLLSLPIAFLIYGGLLSPSSFLIFGYMWDLQMQPTPLSLWTSTDRQVQRWIMAP